MVSRSKPRRVKPTTLMPASRAQRPVAMTKGTMSLRHAGQAADEGMRADPAALLDAGYAAEDGMVADLGVAAEGRLVGQDDVVADDAIVGDVRADHEEAVGADRRLAAAARGAAMDRDVFADDAIRPDRRPTSARPCS